MQGVRLWNLLPYPSAWGLGASLGVTGWASESPQDPTISMQNIIHTFCWAKSHTLHNVLERSVFSQR